MSVRTISAATGIPVGAVHRAKRQLEKSMAQFEGGELGVSHVGQSFRNCISGEMEIKRLRWAAITAV